MTQVHLDSANALYLQGSLYLFERSSFFTSVPHYDKLNNALLVCTVLCQINEIKLQML